jgi:hypothetical protein
MSFLLVPTIYILCNVFFGNNGLIKVHAVYANVLTLTVINANCLYGPYFNESATFLLVIASLKFLVPRLPKSPITII